MKPPGWNWDGSLLEVLLSVIVQSFEFYCRQGIDRSERAQVSFKWNVMIVLSVVW